MNFEHTLQQWVLLDNQIKTYSDKIKELREKKDIIEKSALQFANNNQSAATWTGVAGSVAVAGIAIEIVAYKPKGGAIVGIL
jgi:hypothetical protein